MLLVVPTYTYEYYIIQLEGYTEVHYEWYMYVDEPYKYTSSEWYHQSASTAWSK